MVTGAVWATLYDQTVDHYSVRDWRRLCHGDVDGGGPPQLIASDCHPPPSLPPSTANARREPSFFPCNQARIFGLKISSIASERPMWLQRGQKDFTHPQHAATEALGLEGGTHARRAHGVSTENSEGIGQSSDLSCPAVVSGACSRTSRRLFHG
jgi:hypothetical protein